MLHLVVLLVAIQFLNFPQGISEVGLALKEEVLKTTVRR